MSCALLEPLSKDFPVSAPCALLDCLTFSLPCSSLRGIAYLAWYCFSCLPGSFATTGGLWAYGFCPVLHALLSDSSLRGCVPDSTLILILPCFFLQSLACQGSFVPLGLPCFLLLLLGAFVF